jgi:hypothetical protein
MKKSSDNLNLWFGIIGIILALIGIGISVFGVWISTRERKPTHFLEYSKLSLNTIDAEKSGIKILRKNGEAISGGITSVNFYFWNSGNVSIRKENILKPLTLKIEANPKIKIISARLISVSRDIVKPKIIFNPNKNDQSINIDYEILEKDDGFKIMLVAAGTGDYNLKVQSTIEGVSGLSYPKLIEKINWFNLSLKYFSYLLMWSFFVLMFVLGRILLSKATNDKSKFESNLRRIEKIISRLFLCMYLLGPPFIYVLEMDFPNKVSVNDIVPHSIVLEGKGEGIE